MELMDVGETLYVRNRNDWRKWLEKNSQRSKEIWLIFYYKNSGKVGITYDEAVEEALCFGWIDSIVKKVDEESRAQRFSPRRNRSELSELNKVRISRMLNEGKMTQAGLDSLRHHIQVNNGEMIEHKPFVMPDDIMKLLKNDPEVWNNFNRFPETYKQVRIAYIDHARSRPDEFNRRLKHFMKMTRQNKLFGSHKG